MVTSKQNDVLFVHFLALVLDYFWCFLLRSTCPPNCMSGVRGIFLTFNDHFRVFFVVNPPNDTKKIKQKTWAPCSNHIRSCKPWQLVSPSLGDMLSIGNHLVEFPQRNFVNIQTPEFTQKWLLNTNMLHFQFTSEYRTFTPDLLNVILRGRFNRKTAPCPNATP